MVVRYGTVCPEGFLPVFSVCCEDRAEQLLIAACPRNLDGEFVAQELHQEQSLERLEDFSTRLDETHDRLQPCPHCEET